MIPDEGLWPCVDDGQDQRFEVVLQAAQVNACLRDETADTDVKRCSSNSGVLDSFLRARQACKHASSRENGLEVDSKGRGEVASQCRRARAGESSRS